MIADRLVLSLLLLCLSGCLGMPETVKPVQGFELDRYLGKWHEIARLDHSFERGLEQVTAEDPLERLYAIKKATEQGELEGIYSAGVLGEGMGLNITVWSYMDQLNVGALDSLKTVNHLSKRIYVALR